VPSVVPIVESSPKEPINPYGATKLFLERVLSAYSHAHDLRYVALRYFNAAGAHTSGEIGEIHNPETHLIPLALKAALGTAPPLTVFGNQLDTPDGTCVRDFIHVMDLASAHGKAIEYLDRGGKSIALNLGTGKGTSIAELLAAIKNLTGKDVPHSFAPPRAGDPPVLYAEARLANEVLGWQAQCSLETIVRTAFDWEERLPSYLKQG
jgi:UDP-glucose-4-epimerase GalE